jgi:hypothetical protein
MADQDIFFKQGSEATGDSGDPDDLGALKPIVDGEEVAAAVYTRAIENLRKRTELLRNIGEELLYKTDANTKWVITGSGGGGSVVPAVGLHTTAGSFTVNAPLYVESLNNPSADVFGANDYVFGSSPNELTVTYTSTRRSYEGGNRLVVQWESKPTAELGSAVVPGFLDFAVEGQPLNILIITVREDGLTLGAHLDSALPGLAALLASVGMDITHTGNLTTAMDLSDLDPDDLDKRITGTYERVRHAIPSALLNDFIVANPLNDGDTLAIWFNVFKEDPPGTNGRRQCIPSNSNTTVGPGEPGELFITSENPEHIPNCIPLCRRVGTTLYWLDGTILPLSTHGSYVTFGENGGTVFRFLYSPNTVNGAWQFNSPIGIYSSAPGQPRAINATHTAALSAGTTYRFSEFNFTASDVVNYSSLLMGRFRGVLGNTYNAGDPLSNPPTLRGIDVELVTNSNNHHNSVRGLFSSITINAGARGNNSEDVVGTLSSVTCLGYANAATLRPANLIGSVTLVEVTPSIDVSVGSAITGHNVEVNVVANDSSNQFTNQIVGIKNNVTVLTGESTSTITGIHNVVNTVSGLQVAKSAWAVTNLMYERPNANTGQIGLVLNELTLYDGSSSVGKPYVLNTISCVTNATDVAMIQSDLVFNRNQVREASGGLHVTGDVIIEDNNLNFLDEQGFSAMPAAVYWNKSVARMPSTASGLEAINEYTVLSNGSSNFNVLRFVKGGINESTGIPDVVGNTNVISLIQFSGYWNSSTVHESSEIRAMSFLPTGATRVGGIFYLTVFNPIGSTVASSLTLTGNTADPTTTIWNNATCNLSNFGIVRLPHIEHENPSIYTGDSTFTSAPLGSIIVHSYSGGGMLYVRVDVGTVGSPDLQWRKVNLT